MEKTANEKQVGGDHYRKQTIQHWDLVVANNIPYLEARAIAYLMRWRDKGGLTDLHKAKHFVEKLIEVEEHRLVKETKSEPKPEPAVPETVTEWETLLRDHGLGHWMVWGFKKNNYSKHDIITFRKYLPDGLAARHYTVDLVVGVEAVLDTLRKDDVDRPPAKPEPKTKPEEPAEGSEADMSTREFHRRVVVDSWGMGHWKYLGDGDWERTDGLVYTPGDGYIPEQLKDVDIHHPWDRSKGGWVV